LLSVSAGCFDSGRGGEAKAMEMTLSPLDGGEGEVLVVVEGGREEMEERGEGGGGWEVLSPSQGCGEELKKVEEEEVVMQEEEEEEEEEVYADGSLTIEQGHSFHREVFPEGCLTFEESQVEQGYSFQNKQEEKEEKKKEEEEEEEEEEDGQEGGIVENVVILNPISAAKASPAACVLSTMPGPATFPGYEPHFGAEADAPVEAEEEDEKAYLDRSRSVASLGSPYEAYLGGWGVASSSSCAGGKRIGGAPPPLRTSGDDIMIDTTTPRMYMASPPSSEGSAGFRRKRDMARLGITPPRGGDEGGGVLFFE
jgi:hypothetical protein